MTRTLARIRGVALRPGVSRNNRFYTAESIGKAVARAQERISDGQVPLTMLTHHLAGDDSTAIVGRVTSMTLGADGAARYEAVLADTSQARTIASLVDNRNGIPFLKGVSIRGAWLGPVKHKLVEGKACEYADDLELDGLDFTRSPGVDGAQVDSFADVLALSRESVDGRTLIYESVQEASVAITEDTQDVDPVEEKGAPALKSGKAAAPQTKANNYADPGYQDDKMKRYALDTKSQAKAAWSFINQAKNAKNYTAAQLKRIKQRIIAALKKFGVKVDTKEGWIIDAAVEVTESAALIEYADMAGGGSFAIELTNGPVCLRMSSYCIDPADLEVIGVAAMHAAVDALKGLDPDLDADIDVPGADAEDTDDDNMESATDSAVTEKDAAPSGAGKVEEESPVADKPDATAADATAATTPPETTTSAPAAAPTVTLTDEQFGQLLARLTPAPAAQPEKELAAAGAPAESAPEATEQVTETEDQRIARLVAEGIKAALPGAVQEHVAQNGPPPRKGLVSEHRAPAGAVAADSDYPENWPKDEAGNPVEAHKLSAEQWRRVSRPTIEQAFMGRHSVYRDAS